MAKSYKLKTNKAAAKRFTAVGNGKFKRGQMGKRHILTKKSAKRIRDLRGPTMVHPSDTPAIRQLLPNH